ncbi:MAG: purine-nucleoside phosphorylase [Planctomycetes bacterium]|nr:purine-nucleoside phosphorylase [Planctomycetota bacterium]
MSDVRNASMILRDRFGTAPEIGIILGSGLGGLADRVQGADVARYSDIPGLPMPTVAGHAGQAIVGTLAGKRVVLLRGRWHLYEGYDPVQVTVGVRSLARWGVKGLIVTNASGGISKSLAAGDLMLIADQINLTGESPLRGQPAFIDMTQAYDPGWREAAVAAARDAGIPLKQGVYAGAAGPQYETPAEVRMLAAMGADAVGMSTVLEVIAARHARVRVLGLSCITNMAAGGAAAQKVDHEEVLRTGAAVADRFAALILAILPKLRC